MLPEGARKEAQDLQTPQDFLVWCKGVSVLSQCRARVKGAAKSHNSPAWVQPCTWPKASAHADSYSKWQAFGWNLTSFSIICHQELFIDILLQNHLGVLCITPDSLSEKSSEGRPKKLCTFIGPKAIASHALKERKGNPNDVAPPGGSKGNFSPSPLIPASNPPL